MPPTDNRRHSPAAERNRQPIAQVLGPVLPPSGGLALEVASGTGQHVAHWASELPAWTWLPSDPDPSALASIRAWTGSAPPGRVREPIALDVMTTPPWPGVPASVDAVFCANMIHIAPWPACPALLRGAAHHLPADGVMVLYGPFLVDGQPTSPGNLAFDADLRQRDPAWGLRRLGAVVDAAAAAGLALCEVVAMPANNLTVVFRRTA